VSSDYLDGDDGVDRPYGDLPNQPTILAAGTQPRDCANLCLQTSACVCWAWIKGANPPQCYLKNQLITPIANSERVSGTKDVTLLPHVYAPLPTGAIKPTGWLKNQLQIQSDGLSSHLALFWNDIQHSVWIGGTGDGGLHERTPYWLNGIVPLAYQLNDTTLLGQVNQYINYILSHQASNGWLGPDDDTDGNQYWSKFPILLSLIQYHEANPSDTRVIPAVYKCLQIMRSRMFSVPLGDTWSGARWQDLVLTIHWLLEHDAQGQEQWLWDFAQLAHDQGFNWKNWFDSSSFPTQAVTSTSLWTHGVNNGQAIKSEAVYYRQSKDKTDVDSSNTRVQKLDEYHGQASGIFSCDEHLAGLMPSRGSELCTVVETMYSFSILYSNIGTVSFADRVEQLAFNALPATLTSDMWAHQYLQQSNNVFDDHCDPHVWTNDGPDSNIYGLEPNYGCCTANYHQGWPKYVSNMVFKTQDNGVLVGLYGPITADVSSILGAGAVVTVTTDYPWNNVINVKASGNSKTFPFYLRIPTWADGPTSKIVVNGGSPFTVTPGSVYPIICAAGGCTAVLTLGMKIKLERRFNNAVSIHRGPLLYSLKMGEQFTVLATYAYESKDYAIHNTTAWNYGVQITDLNNPDSSFEYTQTSSVGPTPFSLDACPVKLTGKVRSINWGMNLNAAAAPPQSPVSSTQPLVDAIFLPFGATELRIAEIPLLQN
jgi:hypothetical protein